MVLRSHERFVLVPALLGAALVAVWSAARIYSVIGSRLAIATFRAESETDKTGSASLTVVNSRAAVDFSLWSPKRITAYQNSLANKADAPLALLRIPKIRLEVPVFEGTDDLTLDRGVGRVPGTAKMGHEGNLAIAGHRDGFFRGLQDVVEGDRIELVLPYRRDWYTVHQIRIVTPDDVSALAQTAEPALTLITCYPFYFVGHAPKRYIVAAMLESSDRAELGYGRDSGSTGSTDIYKEKHQ
jgi:sortase A